MTNIEKPGAPDEILVRPAQEADLGRIAEIYAHHVLHGLATFEESPPDTAEFARRREAVLAIGMPYIVAELSGEIVGYAYCSTYRPRPAYRHTVENSVYVDHRYPRRNIGSHLLRELINRVTDTSVRQIIAVIGDSDHTASIKLHEKHGFRLVGTLQGTGFKFGRWVDTVLMQRPVNGGNETIPSS